MKRPINILRCGNCNNPMTPSDIICMRCGWNKQTGEIPNVEVVSHTETNESKKGLIVFLLSLVFCLLAAVSFLAYVHISSKPDRIPLEPAIVIPTPEATVLPKRQVATKQWEEYTAPSGFTGNEFDFLIYLCLREGRALSIDPDIVPFLSDTSISLTKQELECDNKSLLKNVLDGGTYAIHRVSIDETNKIDYISSPSRVTYLRAVNALYKPKGLARAISILEKRQYDGSGFDQQCDELKKALVSLKALETRVAIFQVVLRESVKGLSLANRRRKSIVSDLIRTQINCFWEEIDLFSTDIYERFLNAWETGLYGEVTFIASKYADILKRSAQIEKRIALTKLIRKYEWQKTEELADKFNSYKMISKQLMENSRIMNHRFSSGYLDNVAAHQCLASGLEMNPTDMQSRFLIGKLLVDAQTKGIRDTFINTTEHGSTLSESKDLSVDSSPPLRTASVEGLTVSMGEGQTLRISTSIEKRSPIKMTARSTSSDATLIKTWNTVFYRGRVTSVEIEQWIKSPMFFFDGYNGDAGDWFWISAHQASLWLKKTCPEEFDDKTSLRIQWHELDTPIDGDSAGLAIALAGYSTFKDVPLRQDVNITGSIRSDGSIKAVGGINAKFLRALQNTDSLIAVFPSENESDLASLSPAYLCEQLVLVFDHIDECLPYITNANPNSEQSLSLRTAITAINDLKTGNWDRAYIALNELAINHPEIYNARRLLQLMERYGKQYKEFSAKEVSVEGWGITNKVQAVKKKKRPNTAQLQLCPYCGGKGFNYCSRCKGKGSYYGIEQSGRPSTITNGGGVPHDGSARTVNIECEQCEGAGIIICDRCGGSGTLEK